MRLADLAYLDTDAEEMTTLENEVKAILDFVEQLGQFDTSHIEPLFHPMDLHQRLRPDEITEEDCLHELAAIAPAFSDGLYWVPNVLPSEEEK